MAKKSSDQVVTIKSIAKMCDVSISTVSNVLNHDGSKASREVYDRVMQVVKETGYQPNYLARSLRSISSKTIGLIAEDLSIFSSTPIIESIMDECESEGYSVIVEDLRLFEKWNNSWINDSSIFETVLNKAIRKLSSQNVEGILYVGGHEHTVKGLSISESIPVVMVYSSSEDPSISNYRLDDEKGAFNAINYLFRMGHSSIGIIAGVEGNAHTSNRMKGVKKAYEVAGIPFDSSLVEFTDWGHAEGREAASHLCQKNITALFCFSDIIATGAYSYLLENGIKIGEDISVIGFDNQKFSSYLYPKLTTVKLPLADLGRHSAAKLIWLIENDPPKDQIVSERLIGELIIRDSVCAKK